jgi:MscS family membrane protein
MAAAMNTTTNATINVVDTAAEHLHASLSQSFIHWGGSVGAFIASNPWLMFAAIVIAGFALSYIFVYLCKTVIKQFTKRTETDLDDLLLERLQHPAALSLFILTLNVALVPLSLSSWFASVLNRILFSVNILLLAVMVNRIFNILVRHYGKKVAAKTDTTIDDQIFPIVTKLITAIVFIIAFLFVLLVWGIQIAPLLAGAGIAGIALAFSMQESLKNLFGGVSLAFDGAYSIGDRIKLQDGTAGVVHDVSLRSTKIRLFTGDLVVVPNGKIANENFTTYAQPTTATAVVVPFSVGYGTDTDEIKKIVMPLVKDIPHYMVDADHKTTVDFLEMGPYSLNFRVVFWVNDYTKSWDAKLLITERIYKALTKHKIDIPFPTQTLILKK